MADASVRPAHPGDASAVAALQAAAWRVTYAGTLPEDLIDADVFESTWRAAIEMPPGGRHLVLVALAGSEVVGVAALGPADGHPDLDATETAEVHSLVVDPLHAGGGHGSRLQQAAVDTAREAGFSRAVIWVADPEGPLRRFLQESGWQADGTLRELDLRGDGSTVVRQERLGTLLA